MVVRSNTWNIEDTVPLKSAAFFTNYFAFGGKERVQPISSDKLHTLYRSNGYTLNILFQKLLDRF